MISLGLTQALANKSQELDCANKLHEQVLAWAGIASEEYSDFLWEREGSEEPPWMLFLFWGWLICKPLKLNSWQMSQKCDNFQG